MKEHLYEWSASELVAAVHPSRVRVADIARSFTGARFSNRPLLRSAATLAAALCTRLPRASSALAGIVGAP